MLFSKENKFYVRSLAHVKPAKARLRSPAHLQSSIQEKEVGPVIGCQSYHIILFCSKWFINNIVSYCFYHAILVYHIYV